MLTKSTYISKSTSAAIIVAAVAIYAITSGVITLPESSYTPQPQYNIWNPSLLESMLLHLQEQHPILSHIAALAMVTIGAWTTTIITMRHKLYYDPSHLPAVIYFTLFAALSSPQEILAPPLVALLMTLSIGNLFDAYGRHDMGHKFFSGIFYLGCIPLIYPSTISLAPLMIVAFVLFERSGRELLVGSAALVMPMLLMLYVMWLVGYPFFAELIDHIHSFLGFRGGVAGRWNTIVLMVLTIPIALYVAYRIEEFSIALMSRKRTIYTLFLLLATLLVIFTPSFTPSQLLLAAPAISIFAITALAASSSHRAPIVYLCGIIIALISRFIPF